MWVDIIPDVTPHCFVFVRMALQWVEQFLGHYCLNKLLSILIFGILFFKRIIECTAEKQFFAGNIFAHIMYKLSSLQFKSNRGQ